MVETVQQDGPSSAEFSQAPPAIQGVMGHVFRNLPAKLRSESLRSLLRFALGVAPVAFGFSGGLVVMDSRDLVIQRFLAGFGFGFGGRICCRLFLHRFGFDPVTFVELGLIALCAPHISGCSHLKPFFLPFESGRLCRFKGRAMGLK